MIGEKGLYQQNNKKQTNNNAVMSKNQTLVTVANVTK